MLSASLSQISRDVVAESTSTIIVVPSINVIWIDTDFFIFDAWKQWITDLIKMEIKEKTSLISIHHNIN